MRADAGAAAASCDGCHAPLRAVFGESRAAAEGVTCEACHLIESVKVDPGGASYELDRAGETEYGPLCDAKDHYFHRMGCAPIYEKADYCAACHLLIHEGPDDTELPVFTSYREWEEGAHREADMHCQDCHMVSRAGVAAPGAEERDAIAHHGTLGDEQRLRGRALRIDLQARRTSDSLELTVQLANRGAGHAVPTGLPARRLLLHVRVLDGERELGREERVFGRILVDDTGAEVPFYAATRVARDDRLQSDERRELTIPLTVPTTAAVEASLVWQAVSPAVAARLGTGTPREVTLAVARLEPGATAASSAAE